MCHVSKVLAINVSRNAQIGVRCSGAKKCSQMIEINHFCLCIFQPFTISKSYSPMCLSTQGQNVPSRALHLCTAWHAITLYLLKLPITISRIYSLVLLQLLQCLAVHVCPCSEWKTHHIFSLSQAPFGTQLGNHDHWIGMRSFCACEVVRLPKIPIRQSAFKASKEKPIGNQRSWFRRSLMAGEFGRCLCRLNTSTSRR